MAGTIPAVRKHIIDAIAAEARKLTDRELPMRLSSFVRPYFNGVPAEDLKSGEPATFAAAAAGHLEFGRIRKPGEARVRVFNPTDAKDG